MSQVLKSACAAKGIVLNEATLASLNEQAAARPILKAVIAWIEDIVAKTPALLPYVPQILADLQAGNYLAALTLIGEVLAGLTPPVATPA